MRANITQLYWVSTEYLRPWHSLPWYRMVLLSYNAVQYSMIFADIATNTAMIKVVYRQRDYIWSLFDTGQAMESRKIPNYNAMALQCNGNQFSFTSPQQAPHSLSMRVSYGVSFMSSKPGSCSAMLYTMWWYTGQRYNSTRLYLALMGKLWSVYLSVSQDQVISTGPNCGLCIVHIIYPTTIFFTDI